MKDLYFSSSVTLDDWSGVNYYKRIFKIELFGIKIVIWKKHP